MTKITIIHSLPLEYYPPVTNLINYLSIQKNIHITVFSTDNDKNRETYRNDSVEIHRFNDTGSLIVRKGVTSLINSFKIYLNIAEIKPDILIYYETFSVARSILPVLFIKNKKLLIINHEYFSKQWYQTIASKSIRFLHMLEQKFFYQKANLISQTNRDRRDLFLKDHPYIDKTKMILIPNYPSKNWSHKQKDTQAKVLKTVYIGTLSFDYSYVQEYCEWVIQQKGDILFDIYSYNLDEKTKTYLQGLQSPYIRIFDNGVEYNDIPKCLKNYHLGLVLYKAITKNYKFNAPNKIFEYLALDLDVWCSDKLITAKDYQRLDCYPKMLMVNFEKLKDFNIHKALNKEGLKYVPSPYVCEPVYEELLKELLI